MEKSFDLEPKHPRLKPGLTEVPWLFDKAAGLSPKQIKDELGTGWQIKTMSHNQKTPIESLGSHKWLNQRCLESKRALGKCLEKELRLETNQSHKSSENRYTKLHTGCPCSNPTFHKFSSENLA